MTAPRHTPEPWKASSIGLGPKSRGPYTYPLGGSRHDPELAAANVHRLVACVNYCAGLDDDQLGPLTALEYIGELESRAENAEARADRLAEAAEGLQGYQHKGSGETGTCPICATIDALTAYREAK